MKRVLSLFAPLIALLSCNIIAQAQAASETNITINEGTAARLSLQTQLSSKLSEVGDEVIGVLYEAVRSSDGRVAIPRGTEFIGRVTQVQAGQATAETGHADGRLRDDAHALRHGKNLHLSSQRLTITPTTRSTNRKMTRQSRRRA
jgi:hypothetical protein